MFTQELGVEMVMMQVRNIEVRWTWDFLQVHILVAGEREPGGEVGWIEPGIAENTSMPGFNEQASLAKECNLH